MSTRTIIVEDELGPLEFLTHLLENGFPDIELVGNARTAEQGVAMIAKEKPDLVFLDIHLPDRSGFDLLESLDKQNFETIVCTSYDHYAIKALRLSAIDYLVKPIDLDELRAAIYRYNEKFQDAPEVRISNFLHNKSTSNPQENKIPLPTKTGYQYRQLKEIIRLEADGGYTHFYFTNGDHLLTSRNLKEYEQMLSPYGFFRIHHAHIINLNHVNEYLRGSGGQVVMSDKSVLGVSQRKRDDFLDVLNAI